MQTGVGMLEPGYDPNATVAIMDEMRKTSKGAGAPSVLPLIGHLPITKQFQYLITALVVLILISGVLFVFEFRSTSQAAVSAGTATEMQMLSQRLARGVAQTVLGNQAGFAQVKDAKERFRADLDALMKGGAVRGVDVVATGDDALLSQLQEIATRWEKAEAAANLVLSNQEALTTLNAGVDNINQGNGPLLEVSEQAATQLAQSGGTVKEVAFANQLVMLTQRIAKNSNALRAGDEIDPEVAFLLGKDVGTFRDVLNGLLKGSEPLRLAPVRDGDTRQTLADLQKRFQEYEGRVNAILQNMQKLVAAKQAARAINLDSEPLLKQTEKLSEGFIDAEKGLSLDTLAAAIFGLLALVILIVLVKLFLDDARLRAFQSEQENKRNQEAILRLLNEMGNLAEGDLTVRASVTEDVTGAIADSINFTIEELRSLVTGINSATDQVTKATQEAQAISNRLFEASQRQSREIQAASASVLQMAQSINEVSVTAAQSARVAQQALTAAEKGGVAVQDQITGMNDIRGQIQETSKRIKRLGESSLEIGEIVELISDITEQTNVLALNAAIQAASAGEAGRGFTVVAEEVQRLAERSGEATKQIEAIVKTIQADTQDAVAAMDRSTQGVVEGTKLSDAAGQALDEIRRVSSDLAELIQGISGQTQRQSASVSDVTRGMQGILRITEETTEGTKQTNVSIAELTRLAAELRASVAGFKV
ncbi:MAG: type IV pili methyl-accepting chemotaxis transducer N-terminal domain-containing protein [Betaproteobacteria bacterium]|nr:type IV pili methyl-accepting chemotaxis transducer N-terminal domain-containing protein [Betaproteobacteria bacterium]